MVQAFNLSFKEAEASSPLWLQGQHALQTCTEKPCLKTKNNMINKSLKIIL